MVSGGEKQRDKEKWMQMECDAMQRLCLTRPTQRIRTNGKPKKKSKSILLFTPLLLREAVSTAGLGKGGGDERNRQWRAGQRYLGSPKWVTLSCSAAVLAGESTPLSVDCPSRSLLAQQRQLPRPNTPRDDQSGQSTAQQALGWCDPTSIAQALGVLRENICLR